MAALPTLPAPPRIMAAADGTLYQIVGEVLTPIARADTTAAQAHDAVVMGAAGKWVAEASGARDDIAVTTASLADDATETGVIALGKSGIIHKITLSRNGWLRLYCTAAARTADAARTVDTDPTPGQGVIGEVVVDGTTGNTILLGPKFLASNGDDPVTSDIYYSYTNQSGATGTCDITINRTPLET